MPKIGYHIPIMSRDGIIATLKRIEADLRRAGIEHLYLFGSAARDAARPDSDVDLFFDHEEGKIGLYDLLHLTEFTAGALGRKVDLITRNSLHPVLRPSIKASALRVF
jgi:predicted nucleotidyltransferase